MDTSLFHGDLVASDRILYTPSDFARTNLFHLQESGELTALKPHTSRRENLASCLFFLVLSGSGSLTYDGARHPLKTGDCVFLDCRRPYAHQTSDNLWTLKWVHFYGPNIHAVYEKYAERGGQPCFPCPAPEAYASLLTEIHALAGSSDHIRDMRICEKLTSLLTLLMETSWNPSAGTRASSKKRSLQEVKDYLDAHYAQRITLDDLAERFYLNKFYLTRMFKEQFGTTVNTYLLGVRITHAKQLLRFTELSIERIGQECGMNDANYFSRVFRRVEGMAPGEYRRRW